MSRNPAPLPSFTCAGFGTKSKSGNVKLSGLHTPRPVFATYRPVGQTCPSDCALLDAGCYAQSGNVAIHQKRGLTESFNPLQWALGLPHGALIRWNVSGDVVGPDGEQYREAIRMAHTLRPDLQGWTYTHAWRDHAVADWAQSLPSNVRCVASLDVASDRDEAQMLYGWQTCATVVETADGKGFTDAEARAARSSLGGLPCPAQRVAVGCADCTACARDGLVLFAVHGASHKKARRSLASRRLALA